MTKRDRIVLAVVAVLAVSGAYFMLVLKPIRADIAQLDEQYAQAAQRRDAATADLQAVTTARAAYRRDSATLALLGKAVPEDEGVPSLLYQVENAASRSGVTFASVKVGGGDQAGAAPAPAQPAQPAQPAKGSGTTPAPSGDAAATGAQAAPGLTPLSLTIAFRGSFMRLERFLNRVHRFARVDGERVDIEGRLLNIDAVKLAPSTGGLPELRAEITATAYVSPAAASAAKGAATTASTTTTATQPGVTR